MARLANKAALITGGSSGIGLAAAELFLKEGARVAITSNNQERLDRAIERLNADERCLGIKADAGDVSSIDPMLEKFRAAFGEPDILFLNAGIAGYATLETATEELFDKLMALHVKGPFFTVQKAAPNMPTGSSIVITTSINGHIGMHRTQLYAPSKAAAHQLVRTLAEELAPKKIRVNALCPGPVITDIGRTTGLTEEEGEQVVNYVLDKVPLNRFADAGELAFGALYLASDESSFVTGTELVIDGGWIGVGQ